MIGQKYMTEETTPVEEPLDDGESTEGGNGEPQGKLVKIGEDEYTSEQLTEMAKKAKDHDQLLPEFTKKSQALAKLVGDSNNEEDTANLPNFLKPGWKPKDYGELQGALKEVTEYSQKKVEDGMKAKEESVVAAKKIADDFYAEVLKKDKDFDKPDFQDFVKRHGFRLTGAEDLKSAYSAYSEVGSTGKLTEKRVLENRGKRSSDTVSKPSSGGGDSLPFDPNAIRTGGGDLQSKVKEAFNKITG